jgi:hypothetical protein
MALAVAAFPFQEMAMTATRQFLVTMSAAPDEALSPDRMANRIAGILLAHPQVCCVGMVERTMSVIPLPDLGDDDSDLEMGFRKLRVGINHPSEALSIPFTPAQCRALVAELSKQHPARTARVDHAALDAVLAIRESDKRPGQQVQKNARAQLIITDAICRCVPEVVA